MAEKPKRILAPEVIVDPELLSVPVEHLRGLRHSIIPTIGGFYRISYDGRDDMSPSAGAPRPLVTATFHRHGKEEVTDYSVTGFLLGTLSTSNGKIEPALPLSDTEYAPVVIERLDADATRIVLENR